jgi:hypothetical protein
MRQPGTASPVNPGRTVVLVLLVLIHGLLIYFLASQPLKAAAVNSVLFAVEMCVSLFSRSAVAVLTAGIAALVILGITSVGARGPSKPARVASGSLLQILTPQTDSLVDAVVEIRAVTRLDTRYFFYAFVSTTGSDSIATALHAASDGGDLTGGVRLGDAAVGAGLVYRIQVIASPEPLSIGSSHVPSNAIWSAAVSVVRRVG